MSGSPTTARKPLNEQSLRSPGKCPFPCPLCKQLRDLSKALSEGGWFNPTPKLKNTPKSQRGSPMFLLRAESYYNQNKCFSSANKFPITWKEVPTKKRGWICSCVQERGKTRKWIFNGVYFIERTPPSSRLASKLTKKATQRNSCLSEKIKEQPGRTRATPTSTTGN